MPPPATAMPIGQRLIAAKKLYDTLDPSTMTPDEAALHKQLGQTLASQPAIAVAARRARPPATAYGDPAARTGVVEGLVNGATSNGPNVGLGAAGSAFGRGFKNMVVGGITSLAHPIDAIKSDYAARDAARQRLNAHDLFAADPASPEAGEALRNLTEYALPFAGPMFASAGRKMNSTDPIARSEGTGELAGQVLGPEALKRAGGVVRGVGRAGTRVGATVLGRLPERMVGSVLGSESRPAARAVMAREIGTAGDPGNLPIENFHNNVTSEWNSAGQDVSRVIAADTALNPGKTVNVQPLIESPYSARAQQVGKFARGETAILQQLQRLTEHSEARQAAAAEHVGLRPGVDWFPGDPIEMSPQQMHEFTKDWRKSVAGGFDRMDPTEQAVIGNMHDAIKSTVPDAAATMQDYHDLSRAKESLDEKVPRLQGGPLIPSMIETMRGAATRKVVGGAAWKLPVAYWMNRAAPKPYRYTGTFNPAMAPAANAATLQSTASQAAVRPPSAAVAPTTQPAGGFGGGSPRRAPNPATAPAGTFAMPSPPVEAPSPIVPKRGQSYGNARRTAASPAAAPAPAVAPSAGTIGWHSAAAPAPEFARAATTSAVEANRAFTVEAARLAAERERQYPVRPPGGASTQSNVQQTLRVPSKSSKPEAAAAATAASASASADPLMSAAELFAKVKPTDTLKAAVRAQDTAAMRKRGYTSGKPKAPAAAAPPAPPASAPPATVRAPLAVPPQPEAPITANPLADHPSRSTPIPRKMTAAELAERHSGVSTYVGRPTLATAAPKPPSAVGPKVGTALSTPRGSGTITHSIAKTDGSTLHVVEGVKTDSGRTVVVEPAASTAATTAPASNTAATYTVGDRVVGTDSVGTEYAGVVKSSGVSPKHGPYVEIETKMHGTRIVKAANVRKTAK